MRSRIYSKVAFAIPLLLGALVLAACGDGELQTSEPEQRHTNERYVFFVAGHVFGNPTFRKKNVRNPETFGIYPPFLERIASDIDKYAIDFGVFTGDIVYRNREVEWEAVERDMDSLKLPIHMAPGNHDTARRNLFAARHSVEGKTYRHFSYNGDLFIILDPNIDGWNISGDQLVFLKDVLTTSKQHNNVFVFFHQILWSEKDNKYRKSYINSFEGKAEKINFWSEVHPLFAALDNNIYMFAGDTGARAHFLPTYFQEDNIHFIASGLGGGVNDNYVLVTVPANPAEAPDVQFVWLNFENGPENFQRN